jgi:RNA polymerase-binding transcription factor DksA
VPTSSSPDLDVDAVRSLLEERRTEVLASIGQVDDDAVPAAAGTFGETEHLVDAQQREIDGALVDMFTAELAEVDAALGRIDDGTYGLCERCGIAIGVERLEAVPAARTCVGCG